MSDHELLPLGIKIYRSSVDPEFLSWLKAHSQALDQLHRMQLNENVINGSCYHFAREDVIEYSSQYVLAHSREYVGHDFYRINDQWLNVEAHDDFFPMHSHSGEVSYVIYVDIPQYSVRPLGRAQTGLNYVEGSVEFHYGNRNSLFPDNCKITPQEGQILMFPSEVKHLSYPFRDHSARRVCVSGNLVKRR